MRARIQNSLVVSLVMHGHISPAVRTKKCGIYRCMKEKPENRWCQKNGDRKIRAIFKKFTQNLEKKRTVPMRISLCI